MEFRGREKWVKRVAGMTNKELLEEYVVASIGADHGWGTGREVEEWKQEHVRQVILKKMQS